MKQICAVMLIALFVACGDNKETTEKKETSGNSEIQKETQTYLDKYSKEFQQLVIAVNEGQWTLQTHIVKGDTVSNYKAQQSDKAFADFCGSEENIKTAKRLLEKQKDLTDLQL